MGKCFCTEGTKLESGIQNHTLGTDYVLGVELGWDWDLHSFFQFRFSKVYSSNQGYGGETKLPLKSRYFACFACKLSSNKEKDLLGLKLRCEPSSAAQDHCGALLA